MFPAFFSRDKAADLPDVVDFNYHIKPIISDRCFKCHGPDKAKQEQELGLNTEAGFFKKLKDDSTRHVVVPGHPEQSELYRRIMLDDPEEMMPPPESNLALTDFEKALIKKWIEQGAKYKQHWAFILPTKPVLPKVKNKDWAKGEIDLFILQKLALKEQINAADRDTRLQQLRDFRIRLAIFVQQAGFALLAQPDHDPLVPGFG